MKRHETSLKRGGHFKAAKLLKLVSKEVSRLVRKPQLLKEATVCRLGVIAKESQTTEALQAMDCHVANAPRNDVLQICRLGIPAQQKKECCHVELDPASQRFEKDGVKEVLSPRESEFADGRSKASSDSEQIEQTVAKPLLRNSVSVEQIQDRVRERDHFLNSQCVEKDLTTSVNPSPLIPLPRRGKRVAFTLAEVLITLGIIGVVAALTMPSLITKFQQKSFETAFKKQYSVLNNTIDYLQLEESLGACYLTVVTCPTEDNPRNVCYDAVSSDCDSIKHRMIDILKLSPIKSSISYPNRESVKSGGGVLINPSVGYDNIIRLSKMFVLPDGAILGFSDDARTDMIATSFIVDINGYKGPNRWGYDAFFLTMARNKDKIRLTDEYASMSEKGGSLPRNILINQWSNDYNKNVSFGVWQ